MRVDVEKGRARNPSATAKLKFGPGNACLSSQQIPFEAFEAEMVDIQYSKDKQEISRADPSCTSA